MESETYKFACPHCGQHLEAEPDWAGMECECPGCGKALTVPQPPSAPPAAEPVEPSVPTTQQAAIQTIEKSEEKAPPPPPIITVVRSKEGFFARNRKWLILAFKLSAIQGGDAKRKVAIVACCVILFGFMAALWIVRHGKGTEIPLPDIEKSFVSWFYDHHSGIGNDPPHIKGGVLDFGSGLILGKHDIPLELQSKRLEFDIRSTGNTDKGNGFTRIDLATVDKSDMVFIVLHEDKVYVNSRRNRSEDKIKIADNRGKWMHVKVKMKQNRTEISISGRTIHLHPLNGARFAEIGLGVGKANLSLKNVRSYPSKFHRKAARLYDSGLLNWAENKEERFADAMYKAAQFGLAEAQLAFSRVKELCKGKNVRGINLPDNEIFEWRLKAASQGLRSAQFHVGAMFVLGNGVNRDEREGLKWFRMAAESGDHQAQLQCGRILIWGHAVEHDFFEARKWLLLAQGGFGKDQLSTEDKGETYLSLADSYIFCDEDNRDFKRAENYLYDAIRCGSSKARSRLAELRSRGLL